MGGSTRDSTLALHTPSLVHAIPHALEQKAVALPLLGPVGWGGGPGQPPRAGDNWRAGVQQRCAGPGRQSPRKPKGTHGQMEGKTSAEL